MKSLPMILFAVVATAALAWQQLGPSASAPVASDVSSVTAAVRTVEPVTVYTMRGCPYCRAAIAYLEEIDHPYVNRDVQTDPGAYQEYMAKTRGNPGVPVIEVRGTILQGWNQAEFEELLAAAD